MNSSTPSKFLVIADGEGSIQAVAPAPPVRPQKSAEPPAWNGNAPVGWSIESLEGYPVHEVSITGETLDAMCSDLDAFELVEEDGTPSLRQRASHDK